MKYEGECVAFKLSDGIVEYKWIFQVGIIEKGLDSTKNKDFYTKYLTSTVMYRL